MKHIFTPPTRLANILAAMLIILTPFHAFLTVFASTLIGHYTSLRLWDDAVLLLLTGMVGVWLLYDHKLAKWLFDQTLVRLIVLYILFTLALGFIALTRHEVTAKAFGYAAIVNLRFVVWLVVAMVIAHRSDWLHRNWRKMVLWPALVVCLFAVMQFFVLPAKFLAHFGYDSLKTVTPVTTINQVTNTIRVQSFLRGPNPLGAYLALILGLLATITHFRLKDWRKWGVGGLVTLTLVLTFSRSAWLGLVAIVLTALVMRLQNKHVRLKAVTGWLVVVLCIGGLAALFSQKTVVQDAFLHATPGSHIKDTSNHGHSVALRDGLHDIVSEPLGRGPGTAGPASLYNTGHSPRNSESYYLEIGQEVGWPGLLLFIVINILLGVELYKRRYDKLALGLLGALIGITLINQLAYAWSDDTLAFVWWGLAGIALAQKIQKDT